MKRNTVKYIVLVLLLAFVSRNDALAQEVSRNIAKRVAETFLNKNVRGGRGVSVQLHDITAETEFQNFYIFSADSGFVIVAADERVTPILGYSNTSRFVTENMPENLRSWLSEYDAQIQNARNHEVSPTPEIVTKWNCLKAGVAEPVRGDRNMELSLFTTKWDQGSPYKDKCPLDPDTHGQTEQKKCVTGCTATAVAQVMKYWRHPAQGAGDLRLTVDLIRGRGAVPHHENIYPLYVNFAESLYDWPNMPDQITDSSPQAQIDAVSTLMYHVGVAMHMNYCSVESGARYLCASLNNYFDYSVAAHIEYLDNYCNEDWIGLLKTEINAHRPVLYSGYSAGEGHSFVLCGYDEHDSFLVNWGWSGQSDGYYAIGALNPETVGIGGGTIHDFNDSNYAVLYLLPNDRTLSPPADFNVYNTINFNELQLEWSAALHAESYVIMRNGKFLVETTSTSFLDDDIIGGSYTYQVITVGENHRASIPSGSVTYTKPYTVTTTAFPAEGGITTGDGHYPSGEQCTVTATPNPGYIFKGWYLPSGFIPINPLPTFTFTVTSNLHLIAKFQATTPATDVYNYYCWFDQDYSTVQTGSFQTTETFFALDASALSEGVHTLHVMLDDNGLSAPKTYLFLKAPVMSPTSTYNYHCWFDQDYSTVQTGTFGGGGYSVALDASELDEGIHALHVMLEGNELTSAKTYIFMKAPVTSPTSSYTYHCWFDQDYETVQTGTFGGEGYSFALDASELDNGLHFVSVMLEGNELTSAKRYLFYKKPVGGSGIYRWEYCLNGQWSDAVVTTLVPTVQTLDILTMLPVDPLPIRSVDFEFEPNGGQPEIYAKNTITFRFWDDENRFLDRSAIYVDATVHEPVVADWIQRNTTEIITTPAANQIHWFKLDAEVGDSLAFKSDVYCTMELFAPSGARQFKVMNAASVAFNGICAHESGIYYLAVHDVEGSYENVSVTYLFLREMTAVTALSAGWNWWTPTVWTDISTLQSTLSDYLIQIKVQDEMPTGNITPGKMLKIQTSAACPLSLRGMPITAASITVNPGATWFGYIGESAPITQALNGFPPAVDDKIISQDGGFAVYNGSVWEGTLTTLEPGKGYVYISNATTSKTLVIGE